MILNFLYENFEDITAKEKKMAKEVFKAGKWKELVSDFSEEY